MNRVAWAGAALLLIGCGSNGSTGAPDGLDGGPDGAVEVILDGGGDAATPPDGASLCPAGVCNYQTSSGCSGSTPACVPVASSDGNSAPACGAAGAGTAGASCAAQSDCAAGFFCVPSEGACRKLCCGSDWSGCGSADEHCFTNLEFGDGNGGAKASGAMLCYPVGGCDPLVPSSCTAAGTQCQVVDPTGAVACLPPGSGGTGQACPCQGGFVCLTKSGQSPTCTRLCKAVEGGGTPYCPEDEGVCTHFTRDPAGVGECTAQ